MKNLQFKVNINAPATKVYDFMLGISGYIQVMGNPKNHNRK